MSSIAATFCATLVDEWARGGVTAAFVAPGSRSTPLALALRANREIQVHLFHDERSASFAALGHALATGHPSVVACSSGTAGAHFHAAVIEADHSGVPLIACTADRPPELQHIAAPQTIDQTGLYGRSVRFAVALGVADGQMRGSWRSLGSRLVAEANGRADRPGPVHLNLGFRDPLVAEPGPLPPGRSNGRPWHHDLRTGPEHGAAADAEVAEVWNRLRGLSGIVVAGRGTSDPASVLALARRLGWPVLADHRSGCRAEGQAVAHFDQLLRSERFAAAARTDVVLRFGEPLASKVLSQWLESLDADVVAAQSRSRWLDPERIAGLLVAEVGLARGLLARIPDDYRPSQEAERWGRADRLAEKTIADELGAHGVTEPGVARSVMAGLPAGASLVVASSMPVRDIEWFAPNRRDIRVYANRGANGIDGVVSTAVGVALSGAPTALLIGDVAFLHDSPALVGLRDRPVDLTIVIVDNDGGGIFSFLPQAELLGREAFEQLFGTPHGTDLAALCRAHGIEPTVWDSERDSTATTVTAQRPAEPTMGPVKVVIASTDRAENVAVHDRLNRAVVDVLEG